MKLNYAASAVLFAITTSFISSNDGDIRISSVKTTPVVATNKYYTANRAPLQPLHFIKLPIGSIKPAGWIRKYLELQRNGLTGKLGQISAWLDKNNNAWFSGTGQGDHGWEEVPYWLKGYGDLAYLLSDTAMIRETRSWLNKAMQSQRADGFFGPGYDDRKQNGKQAAPDSWPNMIMLWCLQSYYEYSGDQRVIPFMKKYFQWEASIPDDQMLTRYWEKSRGGDNLYSIYWLYNRTGEQWLLNLANRIHARTDNWNARHKLPNWHNVNIAQGFREPATYFMQKGDSSLLKATYNDFDLVRTLYGQVPGGMFGADENARPGYTDPRQAVETCGMVEQMASDEMLTGITGDPFWADHCEDVAFNTYPAAVMPDFKSLRYLTAPNMVMSDMKNHSPGIQNEGPFLMMNPFSSRCCQHNHTQGWPYYAEHLWMATPDNGLAAILYNSASVTARVGNNNKVTITEQTKYPFEDTIQLQVHPTAPAHFPLYLRIPAWCNGAQVFINGKLQSHESLPSTFTRIEKNWQKGDRVTIVLPRKLAIHTWTANKNSVSINYGPLTFSLKIPERYEQRDSRVSAIADSRWQQHADSKQWPSYEIFPAGSWNYGLCLGEGNPNTLFTVKHKPWPRNDFPFSQETVPIEIQTCGRKIPGWGIDKYGLCDTLPASPVIVHSAKEQITLVPMGAARLRISAFPVAKGTTE
ncbi:Beta-L-arabinofuranosidase, GH127 [Hydrobacter penzbergensis]|uniref:Beta-L-arabinofuranosidase, GH127 n=1 Tax=Hydrobacter penzbergensis TaxID=1235997 RepID=A0A8X8LC05_9BACT|nr:beta-L-arabinofuranosidase domain-containing protein [Hydrobacter penzbergensis]SDX21847.1 Beta-L-arabinofuranosidase, GH127 [Hydrobacter penzbergensis]